VIAISAPEADIESFKDYKVEDNSQEAAKTQEKEKDTTPPPPSPKQEAPKEKATPSAAKESKPVGGSSKPGQKATQATQQDNNGRLVSRLSRCLFTDLNFRSRVYQSCCQSFSERERH